MGDSLLEVGFFVRFDARFSAPARTVELAQAVSAYTERGFVTDRPNDREHMMQAAGVDRKEAEAHAKALKDALAAALATKADIEALSSRFETMLWKHTAALALLNLTVAALLLRILK